jgi:ferredoxin
MAVKVDRSKCSGIGLCEMTAPAVFEVGDDGQAHVLDEAPSDGERGAAYDAASSCPTGAITVDH